MVFYKEGVPITEFNSCSFILLLLLLKILQLSMLDSK